MPVKVKCTSCDKSLQVPDAARGKAVKCPQCQTRIPIPADDDSESSSSSKPKSAKLKPKESTPKVKKAAKAHDSESALASFDLRRAEDTEARICSKCGFDMKFQDEEDNECPECGYDSSEGGMGVKARKKAMKGPDPADFYPGLFKQSWAFVGKNHVLAWRTVLYTFICMSIALLCGFLYLYISMWPPRVFFAFAGTISFLVVPGWMWYLDTEVIKLTLERKDKFKKLNFDFFLASAMGAAFVFWCIVVVIPLLLLPAGLGYVLVNYSGMSELVLPICIGIGVIPAVWMLPVVMSHMAMPIQYKGWMVWKLVPMWAKSLKPLSVWLLLFLVTNIPNISGLATIGAVYGPDLADNFRIMEFNADIERQAFARVLNPNTKKKGQEQVKLKDLPPILPYSLKSAIVPGVILAVMSVINGFTCMFNMRTNGQFTYYNRGVLDLVDKTKEKKYKATERRGDDDDEKPKTPVQQFVESLVLVMVFGLIGLVGGMLYGTLTDAGPMKGILLGMAIGSILAAIAAWFICVKAGFQDSPMWGFLNLFCHPVSSIIFASNDWKERQVYCFQAVNSIVICVVLVICAFAFDAVPLMTSTSGDSQPAAAQGGQPPLNPGMPNPGMMPGGGPSGPPSGPPAQ